MQTSTPEHRLTTVLLVAGVVAGAMVTVTSCLSAALRPGFDVRRHPNSLLVLGDWGWVQTVDFLLYGVLLVAFGLGIRRVAGMRRTGRVAAVGVIVYGLGAGIVVGLNPPPPAFGFPPGTSGGYTGFGQLATSTKLHGLGGMIGFLGMTVACFAFARYFAADGRKGWAAASALAGSSVLAVCGYLAANAGVRTDSFDYLPTWVGSIVLWGYVAAVAGELLADLRRAPR